MFRSNEVSNNNVNECSKAKGAEQKSAKCRKINIILNLH